MREWDSMFGDRAQRPSGRESAALQTLRALCETSTPVSLMAAHMALSCAGNLHVARADGVVVRLPRAPLSPLQGAVVALSFPLGGKVAGFTGAVSWVHQTDQGGLDVTLQLPERIQLGLKRAAVRLPIPRSTVNAMLVGGSVGEAVTAVDISLEGVLIEFPRGRVQDLEPGHRRMLSLQLGKHAVTMEVEVRRRDGARYGMAFIMRGEKPPKLVAILSEVQYMVMARA